LLCSRHNPSLFQRNGTGSHLYTPNLHTLGLQGTHSVERTYIALVGYGFNRCLSLPYIYIISHFVVFVKRFSKKFATFLEKAFVQEKVQFLFTSCRLGFLHRPNLLTHTSCPLDTYIIPHFVIFVKRFLKIFQKTFSRLTAHTYCASLIARPLTLILYHKNTLLSIWQIAQTFAHGEREICAKHRRRPGDDPGRPPHMNKCSYVHTNKKPCIRARL